MIIILIGPSSVGKTTICNQLETLVYCKKIPVLTSRKERSHEDGRTYMCDSDLQYTISEEGAFIDNYAYGNRYVVTEKSYRMALGDSSLFTLDVSPPNWTSDRYPGAKGFAIVLENEQQLIRQLDQNQQSNREDAALHEYRNMINDIKDSDHYRSVETICNYPNKFDIAASEILEHLF